MSTRKLVVFFIGWVFASMMIAVVTAVVLAEILVLVGLVDAATDAYDITLNVITFATFATLVAVPFLLRKRFASDSSDGS